MTNYDEISILCTYKYFYTIIIETTLILISLDRAFKVQLFREGHQNLRYPPYGFDIYLVNVKTIRRMAQSFVAFSEKLNFKKILTLYVFCFLGFSLRKRVLMRKLFFAISTERFQHMNFLKRPEVWVKKACTVFQRYSIYLTA